MPVETNNGRGKASGYQIVADMMNHQRAFLEARGVGITDSGVYSPKTFDVPPTMPLESKAKLVSSDLQGLQVGNVLEIAYRWGKLTLLPEDVLVPGQGFVRTYQAHALIGDVSPTDESMSTAYGPAIGQAVINNNGHIVVGVDVNDLSEMGEISANEAAGIHKHDTQTYQTVVELTFRQTGVSFLDESTTDGSVQIEFSGDQTKVVKPIVRPSFPAL